MISVKHPHLYVATATHAGMKGKNNEDRYLVSAYRLSDKNPLPSLLALVCDGIGGHRAGEVAAELAVNTIQRFVAESDGRQPRDTLHQAVTQASQVIYDQSQKDNAQLGMGATCVCAWVIGDRLYTVSVGDSRLYLLRDNTIRQVTTDHTWIQEAIEYGALTPEQARGHPNAHVIRRHLGSQNPVVPDFRLRLRPDETDEQAEANQGLLLLPGDRLLLCSDGLTDLVEQDEIYQALSTQKREDALRSVINLANERGGHDNITVVAIQVPGDVLTRRRGPLPAEGKPKHKGCSSWALTCALLMIGALLLAGLFAAGWWVFFRDEAVAPSPTATRFHTWTPESAGGSGTATPLPTVKPSATLLPTPTPPQPELDMTTPSPVPPGRPSTQTQTPLTQRPSSPPEVNSSPTTTSGIE